MASTPARAKRRAPRPDDPLTHFASARGEKCRLDFGLNRVLHAKSGEISQFLDNELLPQVRAAFADYRSADKAEIEKEVDQAIEQAQGLPTSSRGRCLLLRQKR